MRLLRGDRGEKERKGGERGSEGERKRQRETERMLTVEYLQPGEKLMVMVQPGPVRSIGEVGDRLRPRNCLINI